MVSHPDQCREQTECCQKQCDALLGGGSAELWVTPFTYLDCSSPVLLENCSLAPKPAYESELLRELVKNIDFQAPLLLPPPPKQLDQNS